MNVTRAFRYELDPNNEQRTLLSKNSGAARFAWNWALTRRIALFEGRTGKDRFSDAFADHREWNRWKRENARWTTEEGPRPLVRKLDRLKRLSRRHSRKEKGSRNKAKSARRLAKLHWQIGNQRHDFLHKLTTRLAKTKSAVVVEDLNLCGILRNRRLAKAFADQGLGEFRRMLTYKAAWYGMRLIVADPHTHPCSNPERRRNAPRGEGCPARGDRKTADCGALRPTGRWSPSCTSQG